MHTPTLDLEPILAGPWGHAHKKKASPDHSGLAWVCTADTTLHYTVQHTTTQTLLCPYILCASKTAEAMQAAHTMTYTITAVLIMLLFFFVLTVYTV